MYIFRRKPPYTKRIAITPPKADANRHGVAIATHLKDEEHYIAEWALFLRLHAAEHDARARLHALHFDAGLFLESIEHETVEVRIVRRVDDHLLRGDRSRKKKSRAGEKHGSSKHDGPLIPVAQA